MLKPRHRTASQPSPVSVVGERAFHFLGATPSTSGGFQTYDTSQQPYNSRSPAPLHSTFQTEQQLPFWRSDPLGTPPSTFFGCPTEEPHYWGGGIKGTTPHCSLGTPPPRVVPVGWIESLFPSQARRGHTESPQGWGKIKEKKQRPMVLLAAGLLGFRNLSAWKEKSSLQPLLPEE